VAHVEHLGRFLHELLDGVGVGARGRDVALKEVIGRLRGCAAIAGRAAAAEQDGVRLKELRRGLEPFWITGCAGRVGHVMAIFAPDEAARDGRGGVVTSPAAPCACARRPPSRPSSAASASDMSGPGPSGSAGVLGSSDFKLPWSAEVCAGSRSLLVLSLTPATAV